jgi:hypothetical protein
MRDAEEASPGGRRKKGRVSSPNYASLRIETKAAILNKNHKKQIV